MDPVSQLGLNTDSMLNYGIGDVQCTSKANTPELLPCGYLVGDREEREPRTFGFLHNSD